MKSNCSKHTDSITHFGNDFKALAEEIGDLRYDAMYDFFVELSLKIARDAKKDRSGGREELASKLTWLSIKISECTPEVTAVWNICKPYMKDK